GRAKLPKSPETSEVSPAGPSRSRLLLLSRTRRLTYNSKAGPRPRASPLATRSRRNGPAADRGRRTHARFVPEDRVMGAATLSPPVTGRHLIAGRWLAPAGARFASHSPHRADEVVGEFPAAGPDEVNQAVATARAAYPAWRRTSRVRRAELFDNLAQLVKRDTDALARLMARECGKVVTECRAEVVEGLHMIQYVFGTGRMPAGDVLASEIPEKDAFMRS